MFNKKSLHERISGFCSENLTSQDESISSDKVTENLMSNDIIPEVQKVQAMQENIPAVKKESVLPNDAASDSTSDNQLLCRMNFDELSTAQQMLLAFDRRMQYVNRPVYIHGISQPAYIQAGVNPNPVFILFLNGQPLGDVKAETNDEVIFYQDNLPKGVIKEWLNGCLQYIPYNPQQKNQPSYPNQNYHATPVTSYNFNINNVPTNVEGIEATERMVSSFISNVPKTATEVNVDVGFSTSQFTEADVIDTTAF